MYLWAPQSDLWALSPRLLLPPYRVLLPIRDHVPELAEGRLPGPLVVAPFADLPLKPQEALRAARPAGLHRIPAPVVFWFPARFAVDALSLMHQAGLVGVGHVVCTDELDTVVATVRRSLTEESLLLPRLRTWLPYVERDLRGDHLLTAMSLVAGEDPGSIPETLGEAGPSPRALRRAFAHAGLPAPHRWNQLGTALRSTLDIQREGEAPLLEIADRRGRHDASSLSKLFRRCFGLNPGDLRGTMGWKWLVVRWLRRWGRSAG